MAFSYLVIATGQYEPDLLGIFDTKQEAIQAINLLQPLATQTVGIYGEEFYIRGDMSRTLQIIQLPKGRLNTTAQDLTRI